MAPRRVPSSPSRSPLAGTRVLEFTWVLAGPYAGELLGFLGAEVIRLESRARPDRMRLPGDRVTRVDKPSADGEEDSLNGAVRFSDLNLSKLSLTLNLSRPEGVELARRLAALSDVVIDNFRPGVLERRGLGYQDLRRLNPSLVMVSISGTGQQGPEREQPSYGSVFGALGGLSHITGYPDGPPVELRNPMDLAAGTMAILGVLAALFRRRATGEGAYVDLSASETQASFIGDLVLEAVLNGRVPGREGNADASMAPHSCYPCAGTDEWVTIAVGSEAEWRALCKAIGAPGMLADSRFGDAASRRAHRQAIDQLIEEWTRSRTAREVMETLQRAGVAAAPTFSLQDLAQDRHLRKRRALARVKHPAIGWHVALAPPWQGIPHGPLRGGPLLGEHNRYLLGELLGLPERELERLAAEQVVY